MEVGLTESVTSVLADYDNRSGPFDMHDLSGAVNSRVAAWRDSKCEIPAEVLADQIALEVLPDYGRKESGWGTYHGPVMEFANGATVPDFSSFTADYVTVWVRRCRDLKHPLLKARFADVAWDLYRKIPQAVCPHDVPRVMVDAVLTGVADGLYPNEIDCIRDLRRALIVAVSLRDDSRTTAVRSSILDYEERVAVDALPGLWGFGFDLLLDDKRKPGTTPEEETRIITALESRLARLSGHDDPAVLDPHHVEGAALRLAGHYRRVNRMEDVRRVLGLYAQSYLKKVDGTDHPAGSAWLEQVHDTLLKFNLHDEAKAILPHYCDAAQRMRRQMPYHQESITIDGNEVEQYLLEMTGGEWEVVFTRLIGRYLPRREIEMGRLREAMKDRTILDLFPPTLVGDDGRTLARVGTLDEDPEGHLVLQYSRSMGFAATFLRLVVDRLVETRHLSVREIADYVYQSPVLDQSKRAIVEAALTAFLAKNWLVAIHLLVPQIEDTIRRLVGLTGGPTMKKKREKHDGMQLRNLDELLRDERVLRILGEDEAFYLRVLLTDQRGWNLRNEVCHGITQLDGFNSATADRLLHALLLLGSLRLKEKAGTTEGPVSEPESEHRETNTAVTAEEI